MLLSVVIPVFNTEKYLPRCLDSVLGQEGDFEVVVVDDGSTDSSPEILHRYASEHSNIRLLSQPNGGQSVARNTGVAAASGDYLWFVDSDDYIAPGCIDGIIRACSDYSPDVLVVGGARDLAGTIRRDIVYPDSLRDVKMSGREMMRRNLFKSVCPPFYIVRRSYFVADSFSFYPGIYHEDCELIPRVVYSAGKVSFLPDVVYYAFSRPGSVTRTPNPKRSEDLMTVASLLSDYSAGIPAADRYLFSRSITDAVNSACKLTRDYSKDDCKSFQDLLYSKRGLLRHLIRCRRPKFVVEGLLMSLFPRRSLTVYRILQGAVNRAGLSTEKSR